MLQFVVPLAKFGGHLRMGPLKDGSVGYFFFTNEKHIILGHPQFFFGGGKI